MDSKSIFASKTFWGAVLAVAAPIAGQFGLTLDVEGWSNDIVSLLGAAIVIWGRWTATKPVKLV
jgi:hypothetical protein